MNGNDILKSLILSYRMFLEESSGENILFLSKNLAEYGLVNDAVALLIRYLTEGGDPGKVQNIIDPFPQQVKDLFKRAETGGEGEEDFDAQSYLEMADLLWDIGSPDDAKQNYVRAIQGLAAKGDVDRANEILATVKERYPDDPEIQNLQIAAAPTGQDILKSLQSMHFDIPPEKEGELRLNLGKALLEDGIVEQGISELKKASMVGGFFGEEAGKAIVDFYISRGELESALPLVDEYLAGEVRLDYLYRIASGFENAGNNDRAIEIYKTIYNANPEFKDVKAKVMPPAPPEEKKPEEVEVPSMPIPEPVQKVEPAPAKVEEPVRVQEAKPEKVVKRTKKVRAVKLDDENIIFV